eukprot:CAMPEP_0177714936 /NCGR_PEP_ID=MMETSP0484_2-20121128/13716_1 /TAXON_ID=354590 /ORGANISM="Rhodomonas lens, Strain RHODO" /LENGTH=379 /DNA_ID=CAMNT_0019226881 /DNA_START=1 /DNA_END=1140 /DNA_ORIENTATION=+
MSLSARNSPSMDSLMVTSDQGLISAPQMKKSAPEKLAPTHDGTSLPGAATGVDRLTSFAATVATAEENVTSCEPGNNQHAVLAALLEDPVHVLLGKPYLGNTYQEVPIQWTQTISGSNNCAAMHNAVHEVSQTFVRPLSFGRRRCFRIHRFTLPENDNLMTELSNFALERADRGLSAESSEEGLRGSNIGGFQAVVSSSDPLSDSLRSVFTDAVHNVSKCDRQILLDTKEEMTPPSSPRKDSPFAAWINVSSKGALNHLHNHGTSVWAAVLYTKVPEPIADAEDHRKPGGSLLLRLSRGTGVRFMEPDEDLHVSRMWLPAEAGELTEHVTEDEEEGKIQYMELQPKQGSVVVFPGWLSHSVSPHFLSEETRVCFASNWS